MNTSSTLNWFKYLSVNIDMQLTLILVWSGHESSENAHANFRLSTLTNSHAILVLVWPEHDQGEDNKLILLLQS